MPTSIVQGAYNKVIGQDLSGFENLTGLKVSVIAGVHYFFRNITLAKECSCAMHTKLAVFTLLLMINSLGYSQGEEDPTFIIVEVMPMFPGGADSLLQYVGRNIKYPPEAREGIQGVVYVQFVVSKSGEVRDIKVLRGIGGGCDAEAVRVVEEMPDWEPGTQRGKAVNVFYTLPVRFVLRGRIKKPKKEKKKKKKEKLEMPFENLEKN